MTSFAVIDLTAASRNIPVFFAYPFFLGCLIVGGSFLCKFAPRMKRVCFYLGLALAGFSLLATLIIEMLIGFVSGMAAG
jgi:hypothetical protein